MMILLKRSLFNEPASSTGFRLNPYSCDDYGGPVVPRNKTRRDLPGWDYRPGRACHTNSKKADRRREGRRN